MSDKTFEVKCLKCGSEDFKVETIIRNTFDRDGHQDFYVAGFRLVCKNKECKNQQDIK